MGTSRKKEFFAVLVAVGLSAAAIYAYRVYYEFTHYRLTGLGPIKLGMREVDVTLAYGRNPDCPPLDSATEKELWFNGREACSTVVRLSQDSKGQFTVSEICSTSFRPTDIVNYAESEADVIRKLGEPSFVSVSPDGTAKWASFEKYNVAFNFERSQLMDTCVLEGKPHRYRTEYGGPEAAAEARKQQEKTELMLAGIDARLKELKALEAQAAADEAAKAADEAAKAAVTPTDAAANRSGSL